MGVYRGKLSIKQGSFGSRYSKMGVFSGKMLKKLVPVLNQKDIYEALPNGALIHNTLTDTNLDFVDFVGKGKILGLSLLK